MQYAIDPNGNNHRLRLYLEAREADGSIDPEGRRVLALVRKEAYERGDD